MKALVYAGPKSAEIRQTPTPVAGPGEALLKMRLCGVCGTDIGIFAGSHPRAKAPLILGHEFVGEVAEATQRFARGQRVVAYPLLSCGACHACRTGSPHVCASLRLIGIDRDGGMAEYLAAPEDLLFPVPEEIDDVLAALVEPLAVAVRAVEQAGVKVADRVAVLGAGPIGLLCAIVAKRAGAAQVLVTDVDVARLRLAAELGFRTVDVSRETLLAAVRDATGGDGADVVFDCAGVGASARDMTQIARPGATICMAALHKGAVPVVLLDLAFKELRLIGSRVYTREQFARSIGLALDLADQLRRLVTRILPLSEAGDVFESMSRPDELTVKVLIDCRSRH